MSWRTLTLGGFALTLCLACACAGAEGGEPGADTLVDASTLCERDESDDFTAAEPLLSGEVASGSLCPVGDRDWLSFETGPADHLLRVSLAMDGSLSPVEPAYIVWSVDAQGAPDRVVAAPPPERLGQPLDELHCVAPGRYLIALHDDGDDAEDLRRPYLFSISSAPDPDPAEPNDDRAGATPLSAGAPITGAVSCRGDEDWFRVEVPAGRQIHLTLTAPVADLQPTLRLLDADGGLIGVRTNPSGPVSETALELAQVLARPGTYFIAVGDDDGRDADPDAPYTLSFDTFADGDDNEPNPHPSSATPLSLAPEPCGDTWGPWRQASGTIGAPGDNDWFRLPLTGCAPQGVLEAEVELLGEGLDASQRWQLASDEQISLTVVRVHAASPCASDGECQALTQPCHSGWDCSGLSNACRPDGLCAGAAVCLPEGRCGAGAIARHYLAPSGPADPASPPPPNRAALSTPLFADEVVYLRVADFGSDGAAPGRPYRLRARVRRDPDPHEPSNVYDPDLLSTFPPNLQADAAEPIAVHDCTGLSPDCCGPDTWIEGAISYEGDMDWYRYAHPCPGEDCNLRVRYQLDPGPVDFVLSVYQGAELWFGGVAGPSAEAPIQPAYAGSFGGDAVGDACFYAFAGHEGEPFYYHLALRDLAEVRDHDPDQRYRFCVERVTRGCEAPCRLWPDGCGLP